MDELRELLLGEFRFVFLVGDRRLSVDDTGHDALHVGLGAIAVALVLRHEICDALEDRQVVAGQREQFAVFLNDHIGLCGGEGDVLDRRHALEGLRVAGLHGAVDVGACRAEIIK